MINILFVCHGNICRSPMAEFIFKTLVKEQGLDDLFFIESAATSTEEIGNPVYPPARRKLAENGISCKGKVARQIRRRDYDDFDLIVGMDYYNINNMLRFFGRDEKKKIFMMKDFSKTKGEVADPWYSGDFQTTYEEICESSIDLLNYCKKEGL